MTKIILPKIFIDPELIRGPLFFFAGPIKGGEDWQSRMCALVSGMLPDELIHLVVPNRWDPDHHLYPYRAEGPEDKFERQTDWEHYYIDLAAQRSRERKGAPVVWLPCESLTHPRTDGQPYARDTYGEIGSLRTYKRFVPDINIIIGAEPDFPGLRVIKRNFRQDLGLTEDYPFHSTIEETAVAAVNYIQSGL
jgi:hypothetical protein